jgi:hypothetical protein
MDTRQIRRQFVPRMLSVILALAAAGCAAEVAVAPAPAPSARASDPTSERPPVSYLDREEHWQVDCRAELRLLADGEDSDPDILRRCAFIHTAEDRHVCAEVLATLADPDLPLEDRRSLASGVLDPHTGSPLDEGQCAAARQTVE